MHLWRQWLKQMAVATLLHVYYLRVAKLLKLTVGQIKVPTSQGVAHLRLLLSPEERGDVSKAKEVDEGVRLKGPEVYFLVPIWWEMRAMPPDTLIVGLTYLEFPAAFRSAAAELKIALVPSQARHNGARSQKRKWLAAKSANRGEKSWLNINWNSLEASQQEHFLECQRSAASVILGTGNVEALVVEQRM